MIVKSTLALVVAALAATAVSKAEHAAHLARMDEIAGFQFDIEDAMAAKAPADVAAGAERMIAAFQSERSYLGKARVPEAAAMLEQALMQTESLKDAAMAGDIAAARSRFEVLGATCVSCHELKADEKVVLRD